MSAAESLPPPALGQSRAKVLPLRAGAKRQLSPRRDWARDVEQPIIARVLAETLTSDGVEAPHPIRNLEIARTFGNSADKLGAELRAGSLPITPGELALLLPLPISGASLVALLRERVGRELRDSGLSCRDPLASNLVAILGRLDVEALLSAREPRPRRRPRRRNWRARLRALFRRR